MTPITSAPEQGLVTALPATLAGLWTAITFTQDIAGRLVVPPDAGVPDARIGLVAACAHATESLAGARREALHLIAEPPQPRVLGFAEERDLVGCLISDCIDLAIDLLGNEDEPLTPAEVLAVTRAVTALCTARSIAQGVRA